MTILCAIRDNETSVWAAFSDCLITSTEFDEGASIVTPNRIMYEQKQTYGFKEVRIEEKLGFLSENLLFGWENSRQEARMLRSTQALTDFEAIAQALQDDRLKNNYLCASWDENDSTSRLMWRQANHRSFVKDFGKFTVFAAGSGRDFVEKLRFLSTGDFSIGAAPDSVCAAIIIIGKLLSEEQGGATGQFYSLGTGGWYKLYYPSPSGIEQLRIGFNHWQRGTSGEPMVTDIVLPWHQDGVDCAVHFSVGENWNLKLAAPIAIASLLADPLPPKQVSLAPLQILSECDWDATFHFCWKSDSHKSFLVWAAEPSFEFKGDIFRKLPHSNITRQKVLELLN